jgi:asparagine synthase (glutamine-hydrolysing)
MCGIIGVLNLTSRESVDPDCLRQANRTMYHRGPNEEGMLVRPNVGLAMRRLSIIDVAEGHQPMANEDGTVHIVYNGETYNHHDLRNELMAFGHQFRTRCDTEAILHAYEQWGIEGCLERLRGMYAFAIWDDRLQTLYICRDRMGVKPLYFAECDGRLYFASEIRGMLVLSKMPRQVDLEALDAFLTVGFVTGPKTIFKGISKLPPAHYLVANGGGWSVHKYWDLSYEVHCRPETELIEKFHELLGQAVKMRLMSEVPLGALLSGGIDSTMIVALMQKVVQMPVRTVSIGFEAAGYDETEKALANARALRTDHHHTAFTGDGMDVYPKAISHMEEPLADAIFVIFYHLYEACRKQGLTVVLNGEGSDELLAGYYWHRGDAWGRPFLKLPYPLRALLAASPVLRARGEGGAGLRRVLCAAPSAVHARYQTWLNIGDPEIKMSLLSPEVRASLNHNGHHPVLDSWADYSTRVSGQSDLNRMLWVQARTRMVDRSNHMVDRMSMAHSVEARVPFMDHKLWEFCASIPENLKLHGSYFNLTEKYILRQAGRNLIPDGTRVRKKKGLAVPYASWLARPRLPDWAETALSESQLRKTALFNPSTVLRLRREHQLGVPERETLLMGVVAIQTWAQMFLESPLTDSP